MNVGMNKPQTVPSGGKPRTSTWYAGAIEFKNGKRKLTPIEFGGVNLWPSDQMMQQTFGLFGVLVVEPVGATWDESENHTLVATVKNANNRPLFTEVVVAGNAKPAAPITAKAKAGTEVRFRILNSGNGAQDSNPKPKVPTENPAPGQLTDATNLIIVEGHDWQEEPFRRNSTVIGNDPLSQVMGTQQVTTLKSYNFVLPSAGGKHRKPGDYDFFYYPTGNALGTLKVTK